MCTYGESYIKEKKVVRLNVFNHVLTIEGVLCYFYVEKGTLRGISKKKNIKISMLRGFFSEK